MALCGARRIENKLRHFSRAVAEAEARGVACTLWRVLISSKIAAPVGRVMWPANVPRPININKIIIKSHLSIASLLHSSLPEKWNCALGAAAWCYHLSLSLAQFRAMWATMRPLVIAPAANLISPLFSSSRPMVNNNIYSQIIAHVYRMICR